MTWRASGPLYEHHSAEVSDPSLLRQVIQNAIKSIFPISFYPPCEQNKNHGLVNLPAPIDS
jgi:hypothetical protein